MKQIFLIKKIIISDKKYWLNESDVMWSETTYYYFLVIFCSAHALNLLSTWLDLSTPHTPQPLHQLHENTTTQHQLELIWSSQWLIQVQIKRESQDVWGWWQQVLHHPENHRDWTRGWLHHWSRRRHGQQHQRREWSQDQDWGIISTRENHHCWWSNRLNLQSK